MLAAKLQANQFNWFKMKLHLCYFLKTKHNQNEGRAEGSQACVLNSLTWHHVVVMMMMMIMHQYELSLKWIDSFSTISACLSLDVVIIVSAFSEGVRGSWSLSPLIIFSISLTCFLTSLFLSLFSHWRWQVTDITAVLSLVAMSQLLVPHPAL